MDAIDADEIQVTLKVSRRAKHPLSESLFAGIRQLAGRTDLHEKVDKLSVKGPSLITGKLEEVDILKDELVLTKSILRVDPRSRAVRSESAFAAIEAAYEEVKDLLPLAAKRKPLRALFKFWNRHFLLLEGLSGISALGAAMAWARWFGGAPIVLNLLKGNRSAIYSALASIFGSLLGFVITAASIVITAVGSDRMALLRNIPITKRCGGFSSRLCGRWRMPLWRARRTGKRP